jgi:hypothetical protein
MFRTTVILTMFSLLIWPLLFAAFQPREDAASERWASPECSPSWSQAPEGTSAAEEEVDDDDVEFLHHACDELTAPRAGCELCDRHGPRHAHVAACDRPVSRPPPCLS